MVYSSSSSEMTAYSIYIWSLSYQFNCDVNKTTRSWLTKISSERYRYCHRLEHIKEASQEVLYQRTARREAHFAYYTTGIVPIEFSAKLFLIFSDMSPELAKVPRNEPKAPSICAGGLLFALFFLYYWNFLWNDLIGVPAVLPYNIDLSICSCHS